MDIRCPAIIKGLEVSSSVTVGLVMKYSILVDLFSSI